MHFSTIIFSLSMLLFLSCSESNPTEPEFKNPKNLYITDLRASVETMEILLDNTISGTSEGQYPGSERSKLDEQLGNARRYLVDGLPEADQNEVDSLTHAWYSACTDLEASVISQYNDLIDPKATKETRYLYENLKKYAPNKLLFGMHDATGYGVGWSGNDDRSDVKDVCGSYPAVFSWDANGIVSSSDVSRFIYRILLAYNNGGINTICWHQIDPEGKSFYYDDVNYAVVPTILPGGQHHYHYKATLQKISRVIKSIRGFKGESVPVIFRPYHEQNGSWFWWGKGRCSDEEFIELWRFTVNYLRDSLGVHNFIYAFSPDGNQYTQKSEYLIQYPGDEYCDVFGLDFYFGQGDTNEILKFQRRAVDIVQYAQERNKLAAVTEVGDRYGWDDTDMLEIDKWFTRCLLGPIKNSSTAKNIAYAAVWRNAHSKHHFAPYPGHASVPDFMDFYNDPLTVFLNDIVNVYVFDSDL